MVTNEFYRKQIINDLLHLCMDVNGMEERMYRKTGEQPTVFFDYSGLTANLQIMVYENKADSPNVIDASFELATDKYHFDIAKAEEAREYLLGLLGNRVEKCTKVFW